MYAYRLKEKVALVTGSTQGIGRAIAAILADAGARVAINGRSPETVASIVTDLESENPSRDLIQASGDVTNPNGADAVLAAVGSVDILVNNLGIFGSAPALDITDEEWRRYFDVNVLAAVRLIRSSLPGMKERGWGRVLNIASDSAVQSTLQQELASGDIPDIVASNLDPVVAPQLLAFPEESWVFDTPLAQENAIDGKIWQVATGAQIQSLVFYNKDLFAAVGVTEAPTSVDDFTAALKAVKAAGGVTPLGTAGEWVTGAQFAMMSNPALLESGDFYTEVTDGDASFADSPYADFLEAYSGWIADGLVDPAALGLKYQDSIDAFTSGTSASIVMGNWLVPSIDEAGVGFEVGVFAAPSLTGDTAPQMSGPAQPYSILEGSENKELALSLVEYLVTDEKAVTTSLESEGNFRQGYTYEGSPLNQEVGAILDAAPGLVIGTSGPGIPGGFGDELNKQV
ncbi:SDR family NAD(P)-dependent oxidoreductase [Microbacterium sp.]